MLGGELDRQTDEWIQGEQADEWSSVGHFLKKILLKYSWFTMVC